MKCRALLFFTPLVLSYGCQNNSERIDQLDTSKKDFLNAICKSEVEEGPFNFGYELRTVFFSKTIISLFGTLNEYINLPHGHVAYEGKTFYKINGQFQELALSDLFATTEQKEFLRSYCEQELKNQEGNYFSGKDPLRAKLKQEDIRTFVIDDKALMIIFQPYVAGGSADGPFLVKIPYPYLKNRWNTAHPFPDVLNKVIASESFVASWDEDDSFRTFEAKMEKLEPTDSTSI